MSQSRIVRLHFCSLNAASSHDPFYERDRGPGVRDTGAGRLIGVWLKRLCGVTPLWVVEGGATAAGAGLVSRMLLVATVLTHLVVPLSLARLGTSGVLVVGLLLFGAPAPGLPGLRRSCWGFGSLGRARMGFCILTVVG
jgi:hypothetical protein